MHPFYYRATSNFGDAINSWMWKALIPKLLDPEDGIRLVGIGTLIRSELEYVKGLKVIFGSGSGYGSVPDDSAIRRWAVYCVRGPLTARSLGLNPRTAITDSAWLVESLPEFSGPVDRTGTLFIPHWSTAVYGVWRDICSMAGVEYIDPLGDSRKILHRIRNAKLVVAEAMHGAIMADCFRIPWIPVVTSRTILSFKWLDWCKSVGIAYEPVVFPPSDLFDCLVQRRLRSISGPQQPNATILTECLQLPRRNAKPFSRVTKLRYRSRPFLRRTRSIVLNCIQPLRNIWPASTFNQRHKEHLAERLQRLQAGPVYLSKDTVHRELRDKLQETLARLVAEYPDLCVRAARML